ncbi:MAG: 16S rRNA (cytosine(1402)-N(4))-methyltransferase [Verrucomicrobiia bacterium]
MNGEKLLKEASYHEPVLVCEVVEVLQPAPGKCYLDATLGGGGHSEVLLNAGARVLGWDRDPVAISFASKRLMRFGDRFSAQKRNFSQIDELPENGFDGVLLDLGVSSHQFDTPERGFSFRFGCGFGYAHGSVTRATAISTFTSGNGGGYGFLVA